MADTLHTLYTELFTKVMEDDESSQRYYLSMVETQRKISVDYLQNLGALFIPNNDYITHYLGQKVLTSNAGLYYDGQCPWVMFVLLPVRSLDGEIMGLVGWDAYNKYKEVAEGEKGLVAYRVSAKSVFSREKFFLSDIDVLRKTFDSRVIFVTDGVFDTVSLCSRGLPSIALLGSSFSQEIIYFLSWYKHIYVCADNDRAGLMLVEKLKKAVPGVHRILQDKTKDIEELLRSDNGQKENRLRDLLLNPVAGDVNITAGNTGFRRMKFNH